MRLGTDQAVIGKPPEVLRFGASGPRLAEMSIAPTGDRTQSLSRATLVIGRVGLSMRFLIFNSYFGAAGGKQTPPTSINIVGISLYLNGGSTTPTFVTFNGQRGVTIPAGEYVWTDPVKVSSFAPLARFAPGQLFWWHESRLLPNNTGVHTVGPTVTYSGAEGDAFFAICTPANYTNQVDTAGNMTVPTGGLVATDFVAAGWTDEGTTPVPGGIAANNMGCGPSACVMSVLDADGSSVLLVGPSTASGREDTRTPAPVLAGWGFADRAAQALSASSFAWQHATRTGATVANLGANPDIDVLYKFADKLFLWVGNNGLEGGATAAQELVNTQVVLNKFGRTDTTLTLGMPRTSSTDDWATDANQTYTSTAAGPIGKYVQFSRLLAAENAAGRIKNVLPFPAIRSVNDILHWYPDTPPVTTDGLHPSPTGVPIEAADVEDVYTTYADWPNVQRNYAMAAIVRPPRSSADAVADFRAAVDAAGISLFAAWALSTPLDNGDTGQIREVDISGNYWPMVTNPSTDPSWNINYSIYGTRAGSSTYGYLRPLIVPANHFPTAMASAMAFMIDVPDCADQLSILATGNTGSADTFVFYPYLTGNAVVRLNSGTSINFPALCQTGLYTANLGGGNLQLYRDTTLLGTQAQAAANRASSGIRLWNQIGGAANLSRRGTRFFCIVSHTLTTQQQAALAAAAQTLIDYFTAQQVANFDPIANGFFESIEDLTGSPPTSDQQTWFRTYVLQALDNAGYLDSLDYLSIHHFIAASVGQLNVIRPRNISTIAGGAGTIDFVAGSGSKFSTAPIISDVGPNNGSNGVGLHMQQNSNTLIWRGEVLGQTSPSVVGTNEDAINPRNASNQISVRGTSATPDPVTPAGGTLSGAHTVAMDRGNSANFQVYTDGAADGAAITRASSAFSSNNPINVGARSGSGSPGVDTVNRARWVLAGASLGSAGQASIHSILAAADASMP